MRVKKTIKWAIYKKFIKKSNIPLYDVAEGLIVGIINRTQSGLDRNNKPFKAYSTAYAERKGETTVTLTDKGTMLHAIDRKKITGGIKLYFPNKNESAKAHGNQVKYKRKFFGLTKKQKAHIKKKLGAYIVNKGNKGFK